MSDRAGYMRLVQSRPELFCNPAGAGFEILLDDAQICHAEKQVAENLRAVGAPAEWAEVGVAFQDQYTLILRDAVRFPDGSLGTYIRMVGPAEPFPGVVILPIWQGKVLLIRHFRHATRSWHLEIPRGFGVDADARVSARRELEEEIEASDIILQSLGQVYADAGASDSAVALFYAEIGSYGRPERHEAITGIEPVDVAELERMIRDGEVNDGYLLSAYAAAKARHLI
jgi:ADP-ribose pyrophosphatase